MLARAFRPPHGGHTLSGTVPLFPSGLPSQILLPAAGQELTGLTVEDFTLDGCQQTEPGAAREWLCKVTGQDQTGRAFLWVKEPFGEFNEKASDNGL